MAKIKTKDVVLVAGGGALLSYLLIPVVSDTVDDVVGAPLSIIKEKIIEGGTAVKEVLVEGGTAVKEVFTSTYEKVTDVITTPIDWVKDGAAAVGDTVDTGIDWLKNLSEKIESYETSGTIIRWFSESWKKIPLLPIPLSPTFETAIKSIQNIIPTVTPTVKETVSTISSATKKVSSGVKGVYEKAKEQAKTSTFMSRMVARYERGEIALGG